MRVLSLVICAVSILIAIPVIRPMLAELDATHRDCAQTTPAKRTEAQRARCKPGRPAGFVIPGVL